MKWSKAKPQVPGFYWLRMLNCSPCAEQPPHIRKVDFDEGELYTLMYSYGEYEFDNEVSELDEMWEFAGPIEEPINN